MSPSPPTYTPLSTAQSSQSDYHQAFLILFVVLPYFLITVLTPTTASLATLLPCLFFFSLFHLYTHPYLISCLIPSLQTDSSEGQRKLWQAGNVQLASLLVSTGGLVGAKLGHFSGEESAWWVLFFVGICMTLAWNLTMYERIDKLEKQERGEGQLPR